MQNNRSQWLSRNNRTDCDCDIENHHSLTMVVICRPLLLPKAHKKQFNQISCKNTLLLQSFRSITVNFSPFYHQSSDIRTICRELKKTSENNRSRWLSKNNRTDCDGKKWPKTSTSHRCYKKTSQELRMLSSVTLNCQVTKIVMDSGSQLSEL